VGLIKGWVPAGFWLVFCVEHLAGFLCGRAEHSAGFLRGRAEHSGRFTHQLVKRLYLP
jgi:hypothetical protein